VRVSSFAPTRRKNRSIQVPQPTINSLREVLVAAEGK